VDERVFITLGDVGVNRDESGRCNDNRESGVWLVNIIVATHESLALLLLIKHWTLF